MEEWDNTLWWIMLATGVGAALVSVGAGVLDRQALPPTPRARVLIHLISYGLVTVSILSFVARGFLSPA
jgi:hypothetical protein